MTMACDIGVINLSSFLISQLLLVLIELTTLNLVTTICMTFVWNCDKLTFECVIYSVVQLAASMI